MPPPKLAFDESSLLIVPGATDYRVDAKIEGAAAATIALGETTQPMVQGADGTWSATITYDPLLIGEHGDELYLNAIGLDGSTIYEALATVAPKARTQDVYAFGHENDRAVVAGITVEGLDDGVRRFYVGTVIFLAGGLLLSLLYRLHRKRMSVVAHTMLVIILAVILLRF